LRRGLYECHSSLFSHMLIEGKSRSVAFGAGSWISFKYAFALNGRRYDDIGSPGTSCLWVSLQRGHLYRQLQKEISCRQVESDTGVRTVLCRTADHVFKLEPKEWCPSSICLHFPLCNEPESQIQLEYHPPTTSYTVTSTCPIYHNNTIIYQSKISKSLL
jgi:hypothetical protein